MTKPATVAEEAQALAQWLGGGQELAQWLGTGQALLARLQELHGKAWLLTDVGIAGEKALTSNRLLVGILIREAVEHFGRMPR